MSKREGWSWGTTDGGQWLTILGTHHTPAKLTGTPEEAVRHEYYDQPWMADRGVTLAHVTEVWHPGVASGRAYRINKTTKLS